MGMLVNSKRFAAAGGGGGPDPNLSSVKLLMGFEGADGSTAFTDESPSARAMTANGNAQIDTAQFKFGTAAGLFDGAGDYVSAADSADWDFGTGDFTIEFFVRHGTTGTHGYVEQYVGSGNRAWSFLRETGQVRFFAWVGGSRKDLLGPTVAIVANQWYHHCVDRSSGTSRLYVDGTMVASTALQNGAFDNATSTLNVGRGNATNFLNGWMDELRITKGVARYGSDAGFTVPAAAYPRT